MPTPYTEFDPETGTLVEVPYYTLGEVAAMWHMSEATVRRRVKREGWDVFHPLPGLYLMNARQIGAAKATMTGPVSNGHHPDVPEGGPARLGVPVNPADLEGFREPTPDPEGDRDE